MNLPARLFPRPYACCPVPDEYFPAMPHGFPRRMRFSARLCGVFPTHGGHGLAKGKAFFRGAFPAPDVLYPHSDAFASAAERTAADGLFPVCGASCGKIPRRSFSGGRAEPLSALSFGVSLVIAGFRVADGVLHARLGASGRFPYPRASGRKSQNDQYGHGKKASHALSRLCCRFSGASGAACRASLPKERRRACSALFSNGKRKLPGRFRQEHRLRIPGPVTLNAYLCTVKKLRGVTKRRSPTSRPPLEKPAPRFVNRRELLT